MWLAKFRERFVEAALDALWEQWSTLGVRAVGHTIDRWPVDPEGLIVATVSFGRYDPRLFDAFVQWWADNGQWISSTRLQRLARDLSDDERDILSAVADSVSLHQNKHKRQRLASATHDRTTRVPIELFLLKNGSPLPMVGPPDPIFLKRGLLRSKFESRRVAEAPDLSRRGNLRIRLRGLFGLTSRAEIFLFLLTHDTGHARLIARQTHFAYAPVTRAIKQMAAAELLSERRMGREIEYTLRRSNEWMGVLHLPGRAAWLEWVRLFSALRGILQCVVRLQGRRPTKAILGPELYQCAMAANRFIEESELDFSFGQLRGDLSGYIEQFERDAWKLFRKVGVGSAG